MDDLIRLTAILGVVAALFGLGFGMWYWSRNKD